MSLAIEVNQVSKTYPLEQIPFTLRHDARRLWRGETAPSPNGFLALQDISFTVMEGESVGIVGNNGAGKTTLLRLLAGISRPSSGFIKVYTPFATLIGLGAGFDMERSGRENIYLCAALQGMAPHQVKPLLHDIIAFAELGDFLDRPVKLYSSGMVARLGISIAFFTIPRMVFLDEVMAVGDVAFQARCFERLHALKAAGTTLLLVSHTLSSIQQFCERCLWLHQGQLIMDDQAEKVIEGYIASL